MAVEFEINDHTLTIDLERIFARMSPEAKVQVIEQLAIQDDVINAVTDYLCGDAAAWTSGDVNLRQALLERIERSHLAKCVRYSWSPWRDIQQALKDIRSKQHIYWALYHNPDPAISDKIWSYFKANGIESEYTTEKADADIKRVEELVKSTLKAMNAPREVG